MALSQKAREILIVALANKQIANEVADAIDAAEAEAAAAASDAAAAAAFTPAVAGDWDVQPATVAAALNELAARVRILEP